MAGWAAVAASYSLAEPASLDPPKFELAVPPSFGTSVSIRRYRAGEDMVNSPPFRLTTVAAVTERHGWFGPRAAEQEDIHGWTVQVFATFGKKVAAACAAARGGPQTDLKQGSGLIEGDGPSDMTARFRRKNFHWGSAVSFLSQTTQDLMLSAPVNGHLQYEVWGISADQRYTVVGVVSVSHPKLVGSSTLLPRVARSMNALKQDRNYKLIERCKPEEFTPSLTAFDQMLDSLTILTGEKTEREEGSE